MFGKMSWFLRGLLVLELVALWIFYAKFVPGEYHLQALSFSAVLTALLALLQLKGISTEAKGAWGGFVRWVNGLSPVALGLITAVGCLAPALLVYAFISPLRVETVPGAQVLVDGKVLAQAAYSDDENAEWNCSVPVLVSWGQHTVSVKKDPFAPDEPDGVPVPWSFRPRRWTVSLPLQLSLSIGAGDPSSGAGNTQSPLAQWDEPIGKVLCAVAYALDDDSLRNIIDARFSQDGMLLLKGTITGPPGSSGRKLECRLERPGGQVWRTLRTVTVHGEDPENLRTAANELLRELLIELRLPSRAVVASWEGRDKVAYWDQLKLARVELTATKETPSDGARLLAANLAVPMPSGRGDAGQQALNATGDVVVAKVSDSAKEALQRGDAKAAKEYVADLGVIAATASQSQDAHVAESARTALEEVKSSALASGAEGTASVANAVTQTQGAVEKGQLPAVPPDHWAAGSVRVMRPDAGTGTRRNDRPARVERLVPLGGRLERRVSP